MPRIRNRPRCLNPTIDLPHRLPTARRVGHRRIVAPAQQSRRERAWRYHRRRPVGRDQPPTPMAAPWIAFTNPGGIRTDIPKNQDGTVTYADVFASQPFRNQLVTLTLTGMQIKDALEQQWLDPEQPRILQVSKGFNYTWDGARPYGRPCDGRPDVAERPSHRSRDELPRDGEQLSIGRRRRLHGF